MSEVQLPKLDWRSRHDPRSKAYPVRAMLSTEGPGRRPVAKLWRASAFRTDQGQEGACVGHACTNELMARPNEVQISHPNAFAQLLYREAQKNDYWPGEDYSGTSVLAGVQEMQKMGYVGEYRWAFGIEDVIGALQELGPVIVGIPWLSGMYETRPGGLVDVSGEIVGGHAILLTGYYPRIRIRQEGWFKRFEVIRWRNSWGPHYGHKGDGFIKVDDLARLLDQGGEACVVMERFTTARTS